jgi:hypothetical protein
MAFTNLGPVVFLNHPSIIEYVYFFGTGFDVGFQQAGADIKPPFTGAQVSATDQRKRKLSSGLTFYQVTLQNHGPNGVACNLQGGGGV